MNFLTSRDSSDGEASESEDSSGAEPSVETEEASEITMSCGSTVIGRDERAVFLKKQSKFCYLYTWKLYSFVQEWWESMFSHGYLI
jgi:hypothetical protein